MDSDLLSKMLVEVSLGKNKEDSVVPMTEEASKMWDKLVVEVAEIKAKGYGIEIPFEAPDVEDLTKDFRGPQVYYKVPPNIDTLSEKDLEKFVDNIWSDLNFRNETKFRVLLTVGSLYGESFGQNSFNAVNEYLKKLHKKRPLKCWTRMCQACKDFDSNLDKGFDHHLINSSITHIKEIEKLMSVTWNWDDPDNKFSKENGKPDKYFKQLIESTSKPVCRILIQSEEFLIKALNVKKRKAK